MGATRYVILGVEAAAAVLLATSCKKDSTTGPVASGYSGTYVGAFVSATINGVLTVTIPAPAASVVARGANLQDARDPSRGTISLSGNLRASGNVYPVSGSFDDATGQLIGVTAGPYSITGGFVNGSFSGSWTGPGGPGSYSSLPSVGGTSAVVMCGVYTGAENGVFSISVAGSLVTGVATPPHRNNQTSATDLLTGQVVTSGNSPFAITIFSIENGVVDSIPAPGLLYLPGDSAIGTWRSVNPVESGIWHVSAVACN